MREWGLFHCSDSVQEFARPREVEDGEGIGPASAKVLSPSEDSELSLGSGELGRVLVLGALEGFKQEGGKRRDEG